MGIDRESEEDFKMSEKSFEIGQRVRIIGPTARGNKASIGKCFVVEEINVPTWRYYGYSRHDCPHIFPASSLELAEPEPDSTDQRFQAIETRLQALEAKAKEDTPQKEVTEQPSIRAGDYVEVVGQPFVVYGLPVGTIDRVSYQAPFGWFTLEGSEAWYPLRSLRKLSDEEIIAKIGWERKA